MAKIKPESRHAARSFWVGIGGLVVIAFLVWVTLEAQYGNPIAPKSYVKAAFKDIDTLQVKDPVRQNGKGIGRVIDIAYGDGEAIVTLQIELGSDYEVYKNATAEIRDQSAVGAKLVMLDPGTADAGPLGDAVIPQAQTKSSVDVYQILDLFDPKTQTSTRNFLTNFGGGLVGQADNLRDFVANAPDTLVALGTLSHAMASKEADLPALFTTAETLTSRFRGREQQIASLIEQTDQTFAAINVDGGKPLGDTLDRAPAALDELRPALDSLNPPLADTRQMAVDFEPGARDLGKSEEKLRDVLRDGSPVLDDVPSVADQATPAVEDLTPAVEDTSTLTPRAADALNMLSTPLKVLAPYSKEFGYLFVRGRSFMSEGTADGVHYARLNADVQGPYSATFGVLKACRPAVNAYPKPGEADRDHTKLGLKNSMPCGVQAHPKLGGSPR